MSRRWLLDPTNIYNYRKELKRFTYWPLWSHWYDSYLGNKLVRSYEVLDTIHAVVLPLKYKRKRYKISWLFIPLLINIDDSRRRCNSRISMKIVGVSPLFLRSPLYICGCCTVFSIFKIKYAYFQYSSPYSPTELSHLTSLICWALSSVCRRHFAFFLSTEVHFCENSCYWNNT